MSEIAETVSDFAVDRIAPTQRPAGRAIGYHTWSELLFVHWRLPAELVRPLIPAALTLDTWDGDAWVGLVPFRMSGIRPWWSPAVPGVSHFLETNVRTYVHLRGKDPGVWFFSLEASSTLAVRLARWRWHLPYFRAAMQLNRKGAQLGYVSQRLQHRGATVTNQPAGCQIVVDVDAPSDFRLFGPGTSHARPGTLEHFLVERYVLYAEPRPGKLLLGRVHHAPYPLRPARLVSLTDSLLPSNQLRPTREPCHTLFSDGVHVEIFPLREVAQH